MPSSSLVMKTEFDTFDVEGLLSKLTGIEDWAGRKPAKAGPLGFGTQATFGAEVVVPGELSRSTTQRYTAKIHLADGYAEVFAFKADKDGLEPGPPDEVNWSLEIDLETDLQHSPYASFFTPAKADIAADVEEPRFAAGPSR